MNKLTSVEIICTLGPSSLFLRSHPKADILLDFYPDLLDIN